MTGKKKQLKHWMELKQTQKFIEDVSKKVVAGIPTASLDDKTAENNNNSPVAGIPATGKPTENNNNSPAARIPATGKTTKNELLTAKNILENNKLSYVVSAGDSSVSEIRGTYLHLDLIPQLCNWASKAYAFKISYIINYINGIKDYDSAYSKLKNDELKAKDDELESKTDEIKKLEEKHQKQLKAKDKEIEIKENKIKDLKKEFKETKKKNERKTSIIKEKNEKVKELKEEIKDKTEELEELRKTKSEDDIEIKKLKQDIELLKSQLAEALKDNKTLNEKIDDFIKAGEKEREELKQCREQINKMTTTQDIILN